MFSSFPCLFEIKIPCGNNPQNVKLTFSLFYIKKTKQNVVENKQHVYINYGL